MRKREKEAWDKKILEVAPPEPFEVITPDPLQENTTIVIMNQQAVQPSDEIDI